MIKIQRKTLLYKSNVEYADFSLNHVEGCSHGCKYPCYAYLMKKRCGIIKTYDEWCHPKIVSNAVELLSSELPKLKSRINSVHLCFTTDPFMYKQNDVTALTLELIRILNGNNIKCNILTKGIYPKILGEISQYEKQNEYGISLVSLNERFRKNFEPNSAPFSDRIKALKLLSNSGCKTWVSIEPYPTPNLDETSMKIENLLREVSFVDKIIFGKLNYNVQSTKFKDNDSFYKTISKTIITFCEKHKIKYHIKSGTPYSKRQTEDIFATTNVK